MTPNISEAASVYNEKSILYKYIKQKKYNLAKILSNNGRYVDDLNTQNYLHFESLIPRIYTLPT